MSARGRSGPRRAGAPALAALIAVLVLAGGARADVRTVADLGVGVTPRGIVLDAGGNLYVAIDGDGGADRVVRITPAGVATPFGAVGTDPSDIAIDGAGNIYVSNYTSGDVSRITPAGAETRIDIPGSGPIAIAVDGAGNVYTANKVSRNVSKIVPGVSATTLGPSSLLLSGVPEDIVVDHSGLVLLSGAVQSGATATRVVTRISPSGAVTLLNGQASAGGPLVLDAQGNLVAGRGPQAGRVYRISPQGAVTAIGWSAQSPPTPTSALAIDAAGSVYAGSTSGAVVRVGANAPEPLEPIGQDDGATAVGLVVDADGTIYSAYSVGVPFVGSASYVFAVTGAGPAPPAVPGAPTAVAGLGRATVTVPAPLASRRFGSPTSFVIRAVNVPGKTCTAPAATRSCVITGLTAGTGYTFTAAAALANWTTAPSAASNAVKPLKAIAIGGSGSAQSGVGGSGQNAGGGTGAASSAALAITRPRWSATRRAVVARVASSDAGRVTLRVLTRRGGRFRQVARATATVRAGRARVIAFRLPRGLPVGVYRLTGVHASGARATARLRVR